MDKQNLIACLEEKGYVAELKENIPVIRINCNSEKEFAKRIKEVKTELMTIGYVGSFGTTLIKN